MPDQLEEILEARNGPTDKLKLGPINSSILEELIARIGGNGFLANKVFKSGVLYQEDRPYLHQYLNPSKDVLPKQSLRPTSLTQTDDHAWRKPEHNNYTALGNFKFSRNFEYPGDSLQDMKVKAAGEDQPFYSYYDKWDFKSPNIHPAVGKIFDMIGTPFHVYNREYATAEDLDAIRELGRSYK